MRLAVLLLCVLSLNACSADCEPILIDDDDDGVYVDPFAGWQDAELDVEVVEVDGVGFELSEVVTVTLSNVGLEDLEIEDYGMDTWSDPNWNVDPSTVPDELEPGESADIEIVYVNTEVQDTVAAFDVYTNDPDEERVSVGLIGRADDARSDVRVSPVVLDYGFTFTDTTAESAITLSNVGDATFEVTAFELTQSAEAFALVTPEVDLVGLLVEPGASADVELSFTPTNVQAASAQLILQTNDVQRPEIRVQIRGNGDGAPGCTPPTIELLSPLAPIAHAIGEGEHLQLSASVSDGEQPASGMWVELFIGDQIIEDELSITGGGVTFDIDLDDWEIIDVLDDFPVGLHTFTLKVTDACPMSATTQFVGAIGVPAASTDADGDGYDVAQGDCDDDDATSFPGRTETADGADNDCDGFVDEDTTASDDDGDGASEDEGDCDDANPDIGPDAEEAANHLDDDCDGSRDEGTSFADDDGDGLSEVGGDCDDDDVMVFAGALEWCDGLDNDCAGGADDECVEAVRPPRIVGDIRTDKFQIPLATQVEAEVVVISDDPELSYVWFADKGSFSGEVDGPVVTWQAPADTPSNQDLVDTFANLQVTVTDSQDRTVSGFTILLFDDANRGAISAVGGTTTCGCAFADRARPGLLVVLFMLCIRSRRRSCP